MFYQIQEFLRAKLYWFNRKEREGVAFVNKNMLLPKDVPCSVIDKLDKNLDPLQIPRHFSDQKSKNVEILGILDRYCQLAAFERDFSIIKHVNNPKDGGSWSDWLIGRQHGDTPIAIFTRLSFVNLFLGKNAPEEYKTWLWQFVRYGRGYKTAQLNNHLTWKALFLATSGVVLNNEELLSEASGYFYDCLKQIKPDGSMPLELVRGEKAASYTLMNLEALVQLENIFTTGSKTLKEAKRDFYECIHYHEAWKKKHGLGNQLHPEDLTEWNWVFMFDIKLGFDKINQNAYVTHFCGSWK